MGIKIGGYGMKVTDLYRCTSKNWLFIHEPMLLLTM